MCVYNSAPQAADRSNNSLTLSFTPTILPFALCFAWFLVWFGFILFQKIREPVPSSKKTLEVAHCALEGSAHLPKLPCGFRIYVTISKHQIMIVCQEQTMLSCIYYL